MRAAALALLGAVTLTSFPIAAQVPRESRLAPQLAAPFDRRLFVLLDEALIEPYAGDTTRSCGCVDHAFGLSRYRPHPQAWPGPAAPLHWRGVREFVEASLPTSFGPYPFHAPEGNRSDHATALARAAQASASGLGPPRNSAEANRWQSALQFYQRAAILEDPAAQVELAYLFAMDNVVARDDTAAAYWNRAAASKGSQLARLSLAFMHMAGRGVQRDDHVALELLRAAGPSRFLGDAYACGLGGTPDYVRAVKAYEAAGGSEANLTLASIYGAGCGVDRDPSKAVTFLSQAAHQGHPLAQIELSRHLLSGAAGQQDAAMAYFWAELARARLPEGEAKAEAQGARDQAAAQLPKAQLAYHQEYAQVILRRSEEMLRSHPARGSSSQTPRP